MFSTMNLLEQDLIPIDEAATAINLDVKRLRGYVWRNSLRDPIGDADFVYGWSCRHLAAVPTSTAAAIPGATLSDEAGAAVSTNSPEVSR